MNTPSKTMLPLHLVAHSRAGDKGDSSLLLVAPYLTEDFDWLCRELTAEKIAQHFGAASPDQVKIIPVASLAAITIVISSQLSGGVTRSHRIDPHGKSLSSHLLDLEIYGRAND
jgi:hypothetical protein